jgi:hypothetical protein
MERVSVLAALVAMASLMILPGCGGGNRTNNVVSQLVLNPTSFSLNEGAVGTLSVTAENTAGTIVAADITFTSSNPAIATVSSGGLICGGVWDVNIINCNATIGPGGVGQVTITATATANTSITATATVYVHEQVDQVSASLGTSCTSLGQAINITGQAFSTSAPGCSPASPCNITSTVGPFTFGSNDPSIAASSSGIVPTFSSATNSPTYSSGGTISGSAGQTCNLSNFNTVINATATVTLTGHNTIASGTHLNVTASGYGGTTAPTTATLSNGTATCSGTAEVVTALTPGVLTAETPGATTVFASVSGVNGVGVPYQTCPVVSIKVHDASSGNTSFSLNPQGTQALTADVLDSMGASIQPTLTWGSSSTAVATIAATGSVNNPGTITAVAPGTAYITAACSYPNCNKFLPAQYSQNVVTASVSGSTTTTVYAASTNSTMLVPFSISTDTPGTAITLPFAPNSIMADPAGAAVYLGSSGGLMVLNVSAGTVATYPVGGSIVAISPDGAYMLLSDPVAGNLNYFNLSTLALTTIQRGVNVSSSAYTPDSATIEWVENSSLGVGVPAGPAGTTTLPAVANAMDIMAQGGLTYITSAAARQIWTNSTCNHVQDQVLSATSPTLIKAIPNGTGAVAVDSPDLDVISTPSTLSAGCPVTTQSAINSYDLGAGNFTAQQLFLSPDSSRVLIVPNLPEIIHFYLPNLSPVIILLAGSPTPFNGGITLDGAHAYFGTSDNTVHRIDTDNLSDVAQIAVNLKDGNGNVTPPNLVCVLP